jgi:thiosulfate/3-mercaptopyruvate sulfurtransferase
MGAVEENYRNPEYLVETDWLAEHLDTENLRVFDCTVNVVPNPDSEQAKQIPFIYQTGRNNFDHGHIPGAGYIDIPGELSDSLSNLPLMLPPEKQFVEAMCKHGVSDDTQVVLYSTSEPNWAARVWWMLRAYGFNHAAILNGGWSKWTTEGYPVSNHACAYKPGQFNAQTRTDVFVGKSKVLSAIDDDKVCIINALPSPIHTGTSDIAFGRKGRISGSVNMPFMDLHDRDTGSYLPASQLQRKFDAIGIDDVTQIITYCGGGIASSNSAFVLTLLGYDNVTVYDASLLEWGNDESLPMEMG